MDATSLRLLTPQRHQLALIIIGKDLHLFELLFFYQ